METEILIDEKGRLVADAGVHLDGKVDLGARMNGFAVHEDNQRNALPGAVFGPDQYDKIPTNIKEPFGQLNNKNVFYFRALYPGDILADRHEIYIPNAPSKISDAHAAGSKVGRWYMANIDHLPFIIKDHKFLSEEGIYGRVDSTGEIKRYFLNKDGMMDSETVTNHPYTGMAIQPGEIIWGGKLNAGWNIPRNPDGSLRTDEFLSNFKLDSLRVPRDTHGDLLEADFVAKWTAENKAAYAEITGNNTLTDAQKRAQKDAMIAEMLQEFEDRIAAAVVTHSEKKMRGTMFTTRSNADATKINKVRDLDMVVDYDDPNTQARFLEAQAKLHKEGKFLKEGKVLQFLKDKNLIDDKDLQLTDWASYKKVRGAMENGLCILEENGGSRQQELLAGLRNLEDKKAKMGASAYKKQAAELNRELDALEETDAGKLHVALVKELDGLQAAHKKSYYRSGKIVVGGKPEEPGVLRPPGEFNESQHRALGGMTSFHAREELVKLCSEATVRSQGYKFWNHKFKYAHYFSPNSEMMIDPETGEFRPSRFGDLCTAYDPATRLVLYKHNHGTASYSSERNRNFSPPYLCGKSLFYLHNPHIISYMVDAVGTVDDPRTFLGMRRAMIDNNANAPTDCPFFNDARKIAEYIETIDIAGGSIAPDGTPVYKAAFSKARMYGDLANTGYRITYMMGGSALAATVGAAAMTAAVQFATAGMVAGVVAGITLPALAAGGLAAVAAFTVTNGYLATQRKFMFTDYEEHFGTDLFRSAQRDHGVTGLSALQDEMVGFGRALCGLVYTHLQNHNRGLQVEIVGYAALAIATAITVGTLTAVTMGSAVPVLSCLTMAGMTATVGASTLGLSKMADIGEKHFKHIYFFETAKMPDTDGIFKGRPNDQFTRLAPSDHTKRNTAIGDHAKQFAQDIPLPSEKPKKQRGGTVILNKEDLASVRKDAASKTLSV